MKADNFKITGAASDGKTKGHYIVEREHEKATEHELKRLEAKLDKHMSLPMQKAHPNGKSQAEAPLPNMRKY